MYKNYTKKLGIAHPLYLKILLIMRLTTVILIASLMQISAAGLAQKITLKQRNVSLETVLKDIRKQSGYDYYYDTDVLSINRLVSVAVNNVNIKEALEATLRGLQLTYEIEGKTISITKAEPPLLEALLSKLTSIDVRGRIVTSDGTPLSGATIKIVGTSLQVNSNGNGEFFLRNVEERSVLQITFVGYKTREIEVATNLGDIKLELSNSALEEVVVSYSTGYQRLSAERSAGSFAKPDMKIIENRTGSMNVLQRLDGLVAGLTVNSAVHAQQNPFLVRGLATIGLPDQLGVYSGTNRNPLFVVDGIPLDDVSTINPQDVADITVLKDAMAASIWGARAANGVIVIVTKKGQQGEKVNISYDSFINFQGKPDLNYAPTLNSSQFIQATREVFDPVLNPWSTVSSYNGTTSTGVAPHERILYNQFRGLVTEDQANASLDSLANVNNRQQISDLWYRNASLMNHTVSISAGTNKYAVYGSAAYTNTVSNRPGESNNAYKINLRQDFSFGKSIQMNLITDLNNGVTSGKRNIEIDNNFYPYQLFQDAAGNNLSMPYMGYLSEDVRIDYQNRSRIDLDYNPLNEFNYGYTKNNNLLSRNVLGLNVKLFEGLKFEGTYGYVKGNGKSESFEDSKSYKVRTELVQFTQAPTTGSNPVYYLPSDGGRYSITNVNQQHWTIRNQLSYNKSWNQDEHQLSLLFGQEAQEQLETRNGSLVRGYNALLQSFGAVDYSTLGVKGVENPVMANNRNRSLLSNDGFNQSEVFTRFSSYYSNVSYSYNRKYAINGSFRVDKSNLFGLDRSAQNKPVWSLGGKWIMSSERFMSNFLWLNNLAVRATYGLTGNSPSPGTASSYDILVTQRSDFLRGGSGLRIATPSNAKLTWESTQTINIGVDFGFLENRITGAIDLYRKKTSDLLGYLPSNTFTGYPSIVGNLGDLENRGLEISLNTINLQKGSFRWSTSFNVAYNKNTITELKLNAPVTTAAGRVSQHYVSGFPAFALFAYKYAGLDEMGDPQIELADGSVTKTRNVAKVTDVRFMGTYQPVWSGGLSNIFSYKNLSLSANAIFNMGHVMRKDVNRFYSGRINHINIANLSSGSGFRGGNLHADFANRWRQSGDELRTDIPVYLSNTSVSDSRRDITYYTYSDLNVVSASYIKLRDITLAYNLPSRLVQKMNADQLTLRVQFSNLMLWKANDDGIDPEYINATIGSRSLLANQRTLSFGLNIKF